MSPASKKSYLEQIRLRYRQAKKAAKTKILDEFCCVCDYHRKHAIRQLNQPFRRKKRISKRQGRKPVYNQKILLKPLTRIWLATDQMCSKRLKSALPLWLPYYQSVYEPLTDAIQNQLLSMSPSTIDRMLNTVKAQHHRKGLSGTKPGTLLKNQIPIKTDHWDISSPGFLEADTVAHCGNSLAGNFVWSVTLTDILTGWTACRATWNKGSHGVCEQIADIEQQLPFPILGFDCDNGSEFLNYHLIRYFTDRPKERMVQFTRSRPYRKNDNAHVEQKNWTHVRQLFGYDRFDQPELVSLMNELYANEWNLYQNYFCPSFKLLEKKKVNSKYYRKYEQPVTPFQRLLKLKQIPDDTKQALQLQYHSLNPFLLKQSIEQKLKHIFNYVSVTSNVRQRI